MEKRIYRSLCITAITAVVLSVAFCTWVFYDFYAEEVALGIKAEFSAMAVATLPTVCVTILVILCGCMVTASQLTHSIIEPIERLGDSLLKKPADSSSEYYGELAPFVDKIASLQDQLEEQRLMDRTELERLDSMRREFSANVSHELKTPLTSISGFAEIIESGMAQTPDDCRLFAGRIVRESSRMISLIEDIIHLSRLDEQSPLELTLCCLSEVVEEMFGSLRPLAVAAGVALTIEGSAPPILAHRALLCELVQNLCENAIKYNRMGGVVKVLLAREDNMAVLRVTDNGIGIAPEHQDMIFQRFYRVDKSRSKQTGGTGLGLSITKHIAERLGGTISLCSELDVGSEFTVRLPAAEIEKII